MRVQYGSVFNYNVSLSRSVGYTFSAKVLHTDTHSYHICGSRGHYDGSVYPVYPVFTCSDPTDLLINMSTKKARNMEGKPERLHKIIYETLRLLLRCSSHGVTSTFATVIVIWGRFYIELCCILRVPYYRKCNSRLFSINFFQPMSKQGTALILKLRLWIL